MARLAAHGLSVDRPAGWDVAIYRRSPTEGATTHPVLHAANFPLPKRRGDFGIGAVERMGPGNVFVVLFEYEPAAAGTPLFADVGRPRPRPGHFHPRALQRTLPGQAGAQWFFTEAGRPFSLYVVLGSYARRQTLVPMAERIVTGLRIEGAA